MLPSYFGVKRKQNAEALKQEAIKMKITNSRSPYIDCKNKFIQFIKIKCQRMCDMFTNNKLNELQSTVRLENRELLSVRRQDIELTCIRIRYKHLTNNY